MSLALFDGLTLTAEIALTSAQSGFGIWDVGTFDSALWGPDQVWTDVSAYVRAFDSTRGFSDGVGAWEAGSFSLTLHNVDGRFSPDNLLGPYVAAGVSSIIPGLPVRVTMTYNGVTYPVFRGYAKRWADGWEVHQGPRTGDAIMTVTGYDEFGRLAKVKANALLVPVGASDTFGQRLHRLLDFCASTAGRDIDVGKQTMQAIDFSNDPMTDIQLTVDSEGGTATVYVEADGTVTARDQYSALEDTRSVNTQITFGDAGGSEIPWEAITEAPLDDDNVINYAVYTIVGGTPQTAADSVSRALYGDCYDRNSNANNLVCETDAQALTLAQWAVALNAIPETRIDSVAVRPRCKPSVLVPLVLGAKMRDLISVTIRPPSSTSHVVSRPCLINGIDLQLAGGDLQVVFRFASATVYQRFAGSRWDVATFGASDLDPTGAKFFV